MSASPISAHAKRQEAHAARAVVGVDAGKFAHCLVVRPSGQANTKPLLFPTTRAGFDQACRFIQDAAPGAQASEVLIGIEFAGNYGFTFAHHLRDRGYRVRSVLPAHTKRWKLVEHNALLKTDAKDATVICDLAAQGRFVTFPFLEPAYAELRYLTSRRERLSLLRGAALSRLRTALQVVFPEVEQVFPQLHRSTPRAFLRAFPGPEEFRAAGRARVLRVLKRASRNHGVEDVYAKLAEGAAQTLALPHAQQAQKDEIPLLLDQLELYQQQLALTEHAMVVALGALPEAPYLLTVPGVAAPTAAMFLGSIGDPRAYHSNREILKLAGLSLIERSSGAHQGKRHISKAGRPSLRKMAFLLALRSVTKAGMFRAEFEALLRRNGNKKLPAVVAVSRSVLTLLFSIARDRRVFTAGPPARPGAKVA